MNCLSCGKITPLDKAYPKRHLKYCSKECKSLGTRGLPSEIQTLLSNREWLFDQRITQKKAIETIGKDLGISPIPIKRWIKIHKIPEVRYNESESSVRLQLSNKTLLEDLHIKQRLTCEEIAQKIGSSKAQISVWLQKHGIITNESNSYPRKIIKISNGCQEIIDYIKSIYNGEIQINTRGVIGSSELDIYLPDKKFAIEYNGVWSHLYRPHAITESQIKGRSYHIGKTNACNALGITLMHIWSSTWENKRSILESIISNKLGLTKINIAARKCTIQEISTHDKNKFLDENHIQGKDKSRFKFALIYQGEIIAIMTMSRARYQKKYKWELTRFAVKKHHNVIGGFSKLLAYYRKRYSGNIISYADLTISNGNVYQKNGFTLSHIAAPSYWYVKNNTETLLHRSNYRKHSLIGDKTKTEWELMQEAGYNKIFDCGHLVFVLE